MMDQQITLGEGGRVVIPSALRKAIGVAQGDHLIIRLQGAELRLFRQQEAVDRIRNAARRIKKKGASVTEDFIDRRRKEWEE